jgi:sec-independent protein translocase protein TatB
MFGMGGSEIIVILIVALLFLGPDKLPEAAKTISKGIRDLKKQSRVLQQTIENDEHIGGAIRDLKSALRGDEVPVRPPVRKQPIEAKPVPTIEPNPDSNGEPKIEPPEQPALAAKPAASVDTSWDATTPQPSLIEAKPAVTLPPTAGEADPDVVTDDSSEDLAAMIKPASGTVSKGSESTPDPEPKQKHG